MTGRELLERALSSKRLSGYILHDAQHMRGYMRYLDAEGLQLCNDYIRMVERNSADLAQIWREAVHLVELWPDDTERELLRLRYLEGMKWEQISDELHYSVGSCHRIHRAALARLSEQNWTQIGHKKDSP